MANVKTSVTFSPAQHNELKTEAYRRGVSISEMVRLAIEEARPGFRDPEKNMPTRLISGRE